MQLQVTAIEQRSVGVKSFELRSPDSRPLTRFAPGAHIRVTIPGLSHTDATRAYSVVSDPADLMRYEIAVLHVEGGNGGSAILHQQVQLGDLLEVSSPRNEFQIDSSAQHSILIAGGIGITPILSLARELARGGDSFEVHYVGRSADRMPYREVLTEIAQKRATIYLSRVDFDLAGILKRGEPGTHVYVCGPHSLIEAVRETALGAGIPAMSIHFESFGYRRMPTDRQIALELRNSGITILVDPGRSLLEAIEAVSIWAPAECRRGECATCVTTIVEGQGDHRDHCLTPEQRSNSICTCVSWAAGDRLVLDI
jgi:ferredoxin-NADP reductase